MSSHKIPGPPLLGMVDYFEDEFVGTGVDLIGDKGPKFGKSVSPRTISPLPRSQTVRQHGKTLGAARVTAAKAVQAINRARQVLGKHVAAAQKQKKVVVGVGVAAKMTPKQQQAVKKHNESLARSKRAAQVLAAQLLKAKGAVVDLAKKAKNQRSVAVSLRKPKTGPTRVRGIDLLGNTEIGAAMQQIFDDYYAAIGAAPDPNNPGFLDDGSSDPAYAEAGPADAALDLGADVPMDTPVELPPPPSMDTFISDMTQVGGIAYDGSKGTPEGYIGSFGLMTRATDIGSGVPKTAGIDPFYHYGYVWGKYHDNGNEKGIQFGDNLEASKWNHVKGRYILGDFREDAYTHKSGGRAVVDETEAFGSNQHSNPKGVSYGPLIGNPALADFKGMRVDGKGRMFWLPQEAPDWLTFPLKQAAAMTAQAEKKAREEAQKADQARAAKEQADAAAAQAQQDAANALAESQAASQAKVSETQQQSQQKQQELEQQKAEQASEAQAQQLMLKQAEVEQAQEAVETEQFKEAGQLILAQAKREQERQAQMPQQGYPGGEEEGGGGEGGGDMAMDDGEQMPGAEIMQDADGEGYYEGEE